MIGETPTRDSPDDVTLTINSRIGNSYSQETVIVEEIQSAAVEAEPRGPEAPMAPHRGTLILVLGILGLAMGLPAAICCGLLVIIPLTCGIIAWVMGSRDLKEMEAGRMDPSGQGLTRAGKICGIISVILSIAVLVFSLIMMLFFFVFSNSRPVILEPAQVF